MPYFRAFPILLHHFWALACALLRQTTTWMISDRITPAVISHLAAFLLVFQVKHNQAMV